MPIRKNIIKLSQAPEIEYELSRIWVVPSGRIWAVYAYASGTTNIYAAYSDDGGISWTEEALMTNQGRPSMFVDGVGDVHVCSTNTVSATYSPMYMKRNGSWSAAEAILSTTPTNGGAVCQALATSGLISYAVMTYATYGTPTQIRMMDRSGGSWGNIVILSLDVGWQATSISACVDSSDVFYVAWLLRNTIDTTQYKIQTATFDTDTGTFSSIATLDSFTRNTSSPFQPVIRICGDDVWCVWARDGLGSYVTKNQLRYAIYSGESWGAAVTHTDWNGNHNGFTVFKYSSTIYLVYNQTGAVTASSAVVNLCYQMYGDSQWSDKILLTEEAVLGQLRPDVFVSGTTAHLLWWDYTGSVYNCVHGRLTLQDYPTPVYKRNEISGGKNAYVSVGKMTSIRDIT